MANGDEQQQLAREFTDVGIDITAPGFSDSQASMAAEANDPALLLKYARYVRGRLLDDASESGSAGESVSCGLY